MSLEKKVPAIRFKRFSESWITKILADVLVERKVLQRISHDAPILAFAAGQGVIDRSERKSNNRDHLTLDQENKKYKLTEYDDIVYNPSNLKYGAIDRNKHGRGVISPIYVTFTTVETSSFIEQIVKSEKFKLRALVFEEGTVVKRQSVKPENLLSLEVNISPSLDEQAAIGNYFQKLDSLINQHQQKHDKLSSIKKAMLEKMFPKQGETVPEIRFKGFGGEWLCNPIGEICGATFGGGTPSTNEKGFWQGEIPWIQSSDIKEGSVSSVTARKCITKTAVNKSATKLISGNSIAIVTRVGVGKLSLMNSEYATSQDFLSLSDLKINAQYAVYVIWKQLQSEKEQVQGTSIKGITKEELLGKFISYPETEDEQTAIGNYFQKLDTLINQHQQQITKLNNIKQACLSKMFV